MKGILNIDLDRNQEFHHLIALNDESNMPWTGPVLGLWITIMWPNYDLNISKEIYDFWAMVPLQLYWYKTDWYTPGFPEWPWVNSDLQPVIYSSEDPHMSFNISNAIV